VPIEKKHICQKKTNLWKIRFYPKKLKLILFPSFAKVWPSIKSSQSIAKHCDQSRIFAKVRQSFQSAKFFREPSRRFASTGESSRNGKETEKCFASFREAGKFLTKSFANSIREASRQVTIREVSRIQRYPGVARGQNQKTCPTLHKKKPLPPVQKLLEWVTPSETPMTQTEIFFRKQTLIFCMDWCPKWVFVKN